MKSRPPFYRRKKITIPLVIILFLISLRLIAPGLLLKKINFELEDFSPTISAQVEDLDLKLIKGGAVLEGISARTKNNDKQFLEISSVNAFVDLGELLKGNVVAKTVINNADFIYSEDLMIAVKEHLRLSKVEEKPSLPLRVARVDLKDSTVRLEGFPSLTRREGVILNDVSARVTNLIPTDDLPKTLFSLQGKLLESGTVKVNGEALIDEKPIKWTLDHEILGLDLTLLNRFLRKNVPLTFEQGTLDFFMEAKSENNIVSGYLKPFVERLKVIETEQVFENVKHIIFEVVAALGNIVVRSDKVAATRVPFIILDGELKTETGESLGKAFEHGFVQELNRGIENSIQLE